MCFKQYIVLLLIFLTFLIYLINIILEIKQYEDNYSIKQLINKKTRKSIHNSLFKSKNKNISHFLNPFFDIIIIIVR